MHYRLLIITLFIMAANNSLNAQFINDLSGSLESQITYYTDDDKVVNPGDTDFRSNNYLRFNYFKNKYSASIQFESYIEEALLGYAPEFDWMVDQQVSLLHLFSIYKKAKLRSVFPGSAVFIEIHGKFVATHLKTQFQWCRPFP